MRNNQPVTGKAHIFPADQTLISVTDLKGRITYCNSNFIMASGFRREELMGQPHNLVRHPDMPEEAFRDLWDTIQGGNPWQALVKNRRKNGDHYWVRANATPVRSGDKIVGYLSVRTAPSEADVAAAEVLYAKMREEAAKGRLVHRLKAGRVVRDTLLGRFFGRFKLGTGGQLAGLILVPSLLPIMAMEVGAPLTAALIAALALSGLALAVLWRVIVRPLNEVLDVANHLAAGDLVQSVEVTQGGIIGRLQLALAQLTVSVRTVVRDVRHEVANLRGGSQEIAAGNQDLSARTESQASSVEETAAAMEEINGTVKQTTHLATEGATLAGEAASVSRRSQEAVQAVAGTMQEIARSSDKISNIIQVIDGVAFQTNILALNAAVEAARAGEQGRGFAVVASEVRALAQRTTSAAREIKELIQESIERVEAGTAQTSNAQQRMDEAMASVEKTAALLGQIRTAALEQETGVSQVSEAVTQLDALTQQNAAMVEELAAAAQSLDGQVSLVHSSIRVFRLTDKDVTLSEEDAVAMRKQFQQTEDAGNGDSVDFSQAVASHQQWRVTLRNAVMRKIKVDDAELGRDDCCPLGKWLHGNGGRRWSHTPSFTRLVQVHKTFHQEAAKIASLINRGQHAQAAQLLEGHTTFGDAGKGLSQLLQEMRTQVGGGQASAPAATASAPARAKLPPAKSVATAPVAAAADSDDWTTF